MTGIAFEGAPDALRSSALKSLREIFPELERHSCLGRPSPRASPGSMPTAGQSITANKPTRLFQEYPYSKIKTACGYLEDRAQFYRLAQVAKEGS